MESNNIIDKPNYTVNVKDIIFICKAFKGMTKQQIFSVSLSNDEYERKANCVYTDNTKDLHPGENGGEVLLLTLANEEYSKTYNFLATKPEIEYMKLITDEFLHNGILIDIY